MQRLGVQAFRFADFHQFTQIHDADAVGNVANDVQAVRDEQEGQSQFLLQLHEQVDHLRLHRHVERGYRFVRDDEFRLERNGPGNPDPLALTAGKFMRITVAAR